MGFGSFVRSVVRPSPVRMGLRLYGAYRDRRRAKKRYAQAVGSAHNRHGERGQVVRENVARATGRYAQSGVTLAGTPSLILNQIQQGAVAENDRLLARDTDRAGRAYDTHRRRSHNTFINHAVRTLFTQKRHFYWGGE